MINTGFLSFEGCQRGDRLALSEVLDSVRFSSNGLVPVIAQDHRSRDVLMLAWMNREALDQTLHSGDMTYWSRSRAQLWRKGEASGHYQRLKTMRIDCDGDSLLCDVEQCGPACHTGRASCFYLKVDANTRSVMVTHSAPKK